MSILRYVSKFNSWLLISILLYLSIDGMYIISAEISEIPDRNTAIYYISALLQILIAWTIGFLFIFRHCFHLFRNYSEGFLITLVFLSMLAFSLVGNFEVTVYTCLIYLVLNGALKLVQTIMRNKQKPKEIIEKDLSDKETIPVETNV